VSSHFFISIAMSTTLLVSSHFLFLLLWQQHFLCPVTFCFCCYGNSTSCVQSLFFISIAMSTTLFVSSHFFISIAMSTTLLVSSHFFISIAPKISGPSAYQRCHCTKLLVCQIKEVHWNHVNTVREVRPLNHSYACDPRGK